MNTILINSHLSPTTLFSIYFNSSNCRRSILKIDIHYCSEWNYKPQAASLAEELRNAVGVEANIIAGRHGIFDVIVDDRLIFSKAQTGRFPEPGEIAGKLK